jgi:hypothetical protein
MKEEDKIVKCDLCFLTVKRRTDLAKHKKSENCKKVSNILKCILNEKNNKINNLENNLSILNEKNKELEIENEILNEKNKNLQEKIILLEKENLMNKEKSEEYRKIVEKAATKTTNTSIKNYNNYLNLISQEPIRFNELSNQLKEVVNCESLMFDEHEFHDHIVDNILKDENGKDKILCTDINRKNFSYKDENSGELISDPELERLRDKLKKGADIKSVKRELLNKLIEQYENTEIDPYVKFCDILKKLDFGNPFIDHVAKKTYIKTKSNYTNTD